MAVPVFLSKVVAIVAPDRRGVQINFELIDQHGF